MPTVAEQKLKAKRSRMGATRFVLIKYYDVKMAA